MKSITIESLERADKDKGTCRRYPAWNITREVHFRGQSTFRWQI